MERPTRRVFVTVGTDHHQFDRLIQWVDSWTPPPHIEVQVTIQHGRSRVPRRHDCVSFLTLEALTEHLERADVVVTQGGPGGIMDALRAGRRPIVVARRAALHEVVDDHQLAFVDLLAERGEVIQATTCEQLHRCLDQGVADPASYRRQRTGMTPAATISAIASVVRQTIEAPGTGWRGRLPRPRGLLYAQPKSRASKL